MRPPPLDYERTRDSLLPASLKNDVLVRITFRALYLFSLLFITSSVVPSDWNSPIDDKYRQQNAELFSQYQEAQELIDQYRGNRGNLGRAQSILLNVINSDPNFAPAYYEMGRIQIMAGYVNNSKFKDGSLESAEAMINRSISIEPQYAEAYALLGHLYTLGKDYTAAQQALTRGDEIGTESPWLDLNWADLLVKIGKPDEALTRYLHALAEGTTNKKAHAVALTGVRRYYEAKRDYAEAEKWYQKGLELEPNDAWTWGNYAAFQLYSLGDENGAIVSAEKALAVRDYGMGRSTLGNALYTKWTRRQEQGASVVELETLLARASGFQPDAKRAAKTLATYKETRFAAIHLLNHLNLSHSYAAGEAPLAGMYDAQGRKQRKPIPAPDAITLWTEALAEQDTARRYHKMMAALDAWSETKPLEALEYIDKLPPGNERNSMRSTAISNAASSQPEFMLSRLDSFSNVQEQFQILRTAMNTLGQINGPRAVAMAEKLYAVDRKKTAMSAAYSGWARTDILAASRHYALLPSRADYPAAGQSILGTYLHVDEEGALLWAEKVDGIGGTILWSRAFSQIAAERPAEVLAMLEEVPLTPDTEKGVRKILKALARTHPQLVADYTEKLPMEALRGGIAVQAVARWAEQDPLSALEWTLTQPPIIQESIYGTLVRKLAQADLSFVIDIPVDSLPSQVRSKWITEVLAVYAKQDLDGAVEWLQQFEDYPNYGDWQMQLSFLIARENPRAAIDLVANFTDSPKYLLTLNSVIGIWASIDAQAAADWVQLECPADAKSGSIQALLRVWNQSDSVAAERWASGLPVSADRDLAFSKLYSFTDPRSAQAKRLLAMINDRDKAFAALKLAIINLWRVDQAATEEIIRTSNLTADQEQILNDDLERMLGHRR
jgi:Tfp pilus assembly protein PilF